MWSLVLAVVAALRAPQDLALENLSPRRLWGARTSDGRVADGERDAAGRPAAHAAFGTSPRNRRSRTLGNLFKAIKDRWGHAPASTLRC
jgi:hypothetical protein